MALDKLVDSTQLNSDLTSVANAIRGKGGTSSPLLFPNGFVNAINNIPTTGVVSVDPIGVNFIDYDGTILYSYDVNTFVNRSSMPGFPTHAGLTSEGWNWTLQNAKDFATGYGQKINIGAMYTTADGKTHLYILIDDENLLTFRLALAISGTAVIDWGDNSGTETVTGTSTTVNTLSNNHTYSAIGSYEITITVTGMLSLLGDTTYGAIIRLPSTITVSNAQQTTAIASILKKVEIGNNIVRLGAYCFYNCYGLETVTIPENVTSIAGNSFRACFSLRSLVVPRNVTSLETYTFYSAASLKMLSLPAGISTVGTYALSYCYQLNYSPTFLYRVSSVSANALYNCSCLTSITIGSTVTSIATNAFANCYGMREIHFKGDTPPTLVSANSFASLPTFCKIYVPSGKLSAYTSAQYYPSSSTYTYIEE